ncbi:hypothetical protein Godav_017249 [Gossypium davidsonii]|uniref:Secreted protein n=1 Tax=Gossypium davidsonii TaxID=34287 RepID=A0A7J8QSU1_GOSDV|nr:hypothetical protein [Gossypium davidsonii]
MMAITFLPVLVLEASLSTECSQTFSIGFYRPRHCSGQPIIQLSKASSKFILTVFPFDGRHRSSSIRWPRQSLKTCSKDSEPFLDYR